MKHLNILAGSILLIASQLSSANVELAFLSIRQWPATNQCGVFSDFSGADEKEKAMFAMGVLDEKNCTVKVPKEVFTQRYSFCAVSQIEYYPELSRPSIGDRGFCAFGELKPSKHNPDKTHYYYFQKNYGAISCQYICMKQ